MSSQHRPVRRERWVRSCHDAGQQGELCRQFGPVWTMRVEEPYRKVGVQATDLSNECRTWTIRFEVADQRMDDTLTDGGPDVSRAESERASAAVLYRARDASLRGKIRHA